MQRSTVIINGEAITITATDTSITIECANPSTGLTCPTHQMRDLNVKGQSAVLTIAPRKKV